MPRSGPDFSALTVRGVIGSFFRRLEDQLSGSWAMSLGTVVPSDQELETYPMLGMSPSLREWKGARLTDPLRVDSFTITNKSYESTLGISMDDLRRDKTAQMAIRISDLATQAAFHWEELFTDVLETNANSYDGVALFATTHSLGDSGTQDNALVAGTVPALNVTTANAPTEDEMVDAIIGVIQELYGYKDDNGNPINGNAREIAVMVPTNMMGSSAAAIRSKLRKSGSDNALGMQEFSVRLVVNPRLASDTQFYVFRTDVAARAVILQDEVGPELQVLGPDSETAFRERKLTFGVYASRNAAPGEPLVAARATLS